MEKQPQSIRSQSTGWLAAAVAVGMACSVVLLPASEPSSVSAGEESRAANVPAGESDMRVTGDRSSRAGSNAVNVIDQTDGASRENRIDDHERTLRVEIQRSPNDRALRHSLIDLIGNRTPPRDSEAYRATRSLLPRRFIEHETRRFIVFSDADSNWTRLQAERLEQAHHQFMRFARQHELQPLPLRHKLICVLFQEREEYLEFAARHDNVNARWIGGYYAPQHDRIVFYNVESGESVHRARHQLAEMSDQHVTLRQHAESARRRGDRSEAERMEEQAGNVLQHMRSQEQRLDSFTAQTIIATTIHEAVHQLAFHTRIQNPHVHYPLWLSEGLATAFETDTPDHAFGPEHEHANRRETFRELLVEDRLIPLRELVSITDNETLSRDAVTAMYHQSYALLTWLHRFRRAQLGAYLRDMRAAQARPLTPRKQLERFESAFGNVESLERAWLRHERSR